MALGALRAAADALEAAVLPTLQAAEDVVLATAVELAEALVGRELTFTAAAGLGPGLDAVGRALASMPGTRPVTVRLSPADLAALDLTKAAALPAAAGRRLEFTADFGVERGGAIADCDAVRIDAQLGAALTRIRAVLEA
jgi:flagellar assembly protein FliH